MTEYEQEFTIAPKTARAFVVNRGQRLRMTDVEGKQVGDFVAYNLDNLREKFSQARTRAFPKNLYATKGSHIYSDKDNIMFTIVEDTCGTHDLIWQPCSKWVYKNRFGVDQEGCAELLAGALADYGYPQIDVVDPFNIFMKTLIHPKGELEIVEPDSKPGDYIEFSAEMNCLCALSTCPNEYMPTNGWKITPIRVEITV
jgi:uncharacterized protein YcgI (DUF1989 family)